MALLLSACGPGRNATPTIGPEVIFTSAAETFAAQMATQQALATPTFTPSPLPSPIPTIALASPLATFSLESPTPLAAVDKNCKRADWMGDITIPDQTWMDPGEKFTKTWLVQNSGTCTWSTKFKLSHKDGLDMQGLSEFVPLEVAPGTQVQISVDMRAPTSHGDYYGRWQLVDEAGVPFGDFLTVLIKVRDFSGSPSP